MSFRSEHIYRACLRNAHEIPDWAKQFQHIASYVAIWTMGAFPQEYTTLDQLLCSYKGMKNWQVIVSFNAFLQKIYVVPSEFEGNVKPMKGRESIRLTRFDDPLRFPHIRRHGLFQVPGRLCFHKKIDWRLEPEGVQSVWYIPKMYLAALSFSAQKALAYREDAFASDLPQEVLVASSSQDSNREQIRKEVLKIGLESGLLIKIPPQHLHMDETQRLNRSLPL